MNDRPEQENSLSPRARNSLRMRLAGIVILTILIPLPWAEESNCNGGPPQIKTGIDYFFREGQGFWLIPIFISIALISAIIDDRFHPAWRILSGLSAALNNFSFGFIAWLAMFLNIGGKTKLLAAGALVLCTMVFLFGESLYRLAIEIQIIWRAWKAKRAKKEHPPPEDSITTIDN